MSLPLDDIEAIVRRQLLPLSDSLGEDAFEYVASSTVSLLKDASVRYDIEEELGEFLYPYLEESCAMDSCRIVDGLITTVLPDCNHTIHVSAEHDNLLCHIEDLTLMYGGSADRLLSNAMLKLLRGCCYGVVGGNGKGKTTLMSKIATGELEFARQIKCCYIQYEGILDEIDPSISCLEYVRLKSECVDALAHLQRMGFSEQACTTSVDHLSGGWRMRLALASAIADGADLLLLDEPTNHLDSSAKAWLQGYLTGDGRKKTTMIISHDHVFLNHVSTDIIHFTSEGKLEYHTGDFGIFWQNMQHNYVSQGQGTLSASTRPESKIDIVLPNPGRDGLGHVVATLTGCNFRYMGQQSIALKDVTLQLTMKCRIGVVGPNGAGKSTLLNLLARELLPLSEGEDNCAVWHHPDLRLAYVAQQHFYHLSEHLGKTPVEYIQHRFGSSWDEELRNRLVLPQCPEAIEYRRTMAAKYGGKPYYWDSASIQWKGREVSAILGQRVNDGKLQYLVKWKVETAEAADVAEDTWETAQKLRFMGVEMLCVAFESRHAYRHMTRRSLRAQEVTRHLQPVGITEHMACQPICSFSAGQLSKLVLAACLWTKPHVVLLDEPTNFLDVETVEALAVAIKKFQGGVVVVSHNADFLQETCTDMWQIEDGHLRIIGKDGNDKSTSIKEKLLVQAVRDREKHARELEVQLATFESTPEHVGHVVSTDKVFHAFQHFIGFNLPEYAVQFAVDTFVSLAEERQPSGSEGWLALVVAAVQMVASIGFEELGDMDNMASILMALLRSLLQTQAVGSVDDGNHVQVTHINKLQSLQFREKATFFQECCYCGRALDSQDIDQHEKYCRMSPMRCGRRLGGKDFEMFHGTSVENAASIERVGFRPSTGGMLGPGVYCSRDLRKARRYGPVVLQLRVQLGRVITIDKRNHPLKTIWQTQVGGSFDAAWVPPNCGVVPSGLEENCVRSPSQILVLGRMT